MRIGALVLLDGRKIKSRTNESVIRFSSFVFINLFDLSLTLLTGLLTEFSHWWMHDVILHFLSQEQTNKSTIERSFTKNAERGSCDSLTGKPPGLLVLIITQFNQDTPRTGSVTAWLIPVLHNEQCVWGISHWLRGQYTSETKRNCAGFYSSSIEWARERENVSHGAEECVCVSVRVRVQSLEWRRPTVCVSFTV